MNIMVTGAKGFIGKNLIAELKNRQVENIYEADIDTDSHVFQVYCSKADFIFHLAGVNRPQDESEFMEGNAGGVSLLTSTLEKYSNICPVLMSSSIQAELDNPYGKSKKAGEDMLIAYGRKTGAPVFVYRLPNVFGKWSRPDYNSAVATFCHNIANGLPIQVNDADVLMRLVYIDDVIEEFIQASSGKSQKSFYSEIPVVYTVRLGEIADLIKSFKESRNNLSVPDMSDSFTKKLYSTYLSYLPLDQFNYPLKMNLDQRGSFTEFIKTQDRGQVSVNIIKPGITKGNHWHHTKNEKFLVVSGKGVVRFRKYWTAEVQEYLVSGDKLEVIDIPTGYVHNIENLGESDLVAIIWGNELLNPDKPDTFSMEV